MMQVMEAGKMAVFADRGGAAFPAPGVDQIAVIHDPQGAVFQSLEPEATQAGALVDSGAETFRIGGVISLAVDFSVRNLLHDLSTGRHIGRAQKGLWIPDL